MTRPLSGPGITSTPPDTQSKVTLSPDAMASTGSKAASNMPKRIVSGAIRTGLPVLHLDRDYDAIASCTPIRVVNA